MAEADKLEAFKTEFGINTVTDIYSTHKHGDHTGGNTTCKAKYADLKIWGGQHDNVSGCTNPVKDQDEWEALGGVKVKGYHTPCHTTGHICFYFDAGIAGAVEHEVEMRK